MEIILPAPHFLIFIMLGIFIVITASILLKKGGLAVKITIIILTAVLCCVVLFFFYRETKLIVSDEGIYTNTYGEVMIPWEKVDRALVVNNLRDSEYNPQYKVCGFDLGEIGYGDFQLRNGKTAYIFVQNRSMGLVIFSGEKIYLFAPEDIDALVHAVKQYVSPDYVHNKEDVHD
jgi:hypothetical protein